MLNTEISIFKYINISIYSVIYSILRTELPIFHMSLPSRCGPSDLPLKHLPPMCLTLVAVRVHAPRALGGCICIFILVAAWFKIFVVVHHDHSGGHKQSPLAPKRQCCSHSARAFSFTPNAVVLAVWIQWVQESFFVFCSCSGGVRGRMHT